MAGRVYAQSNQSIVTAPAEMGDFQSASALTLPAVSTFNGKIDYAGGNMNSYEGNNVGASVSLPVSHALGFQADALYSRISDLNLYSGAGHLFWRNPETGLFGLTGGYLFCDGANSINTYQIGLEGQFYYQQFTFGAFAGIGSIDYKYSAPFIDTNPTKFVGRVSVDYYPLENLRLGASYINSFNNNLGRGEIEYLTPIPGVALTGEVAFGDHGYDDWQLGIRYYFGGKKTLHDRQRQDDPPALTTQILQSLGLYGAESSKKMAAYHAVNPGTEYSGGGYGVIITRIDPGKIPPLLPPIPTSPPATDPPPALP